MDIAIREGVVRSERHNSFYLTAGPETSTPIIFIHGWPELSTSWHRQLSTFGALGFRTVAPDMRGYGRSSRYTRQEDYAVEQIAADMAELLRGLGAEKAIWVGHDWGSPIAWTMASHYPELCHGVVNLCVPYIPGGFATTNLIPLVNRDIYPEAKYPAGQWEYWRFYQENFEDARQGFEQDAAAVIRTLFRAGDPTAAGQPAITAHMRNENGWSWVFDAARELPVDAAVLSDVEYSKYVTALQMNGFFGPDSWYMNDARNVEYATKAANGGRIDLPVLFVNAAYDYVCTTTGSQLGEPMRAACTNLTEAEVESGHWMAQEKPFETNAVIAKWLARELPDHWII